MALILVDVPTLHRQKNGHVSQEEKQEESYESWAPGPVSSRYSETKAAKS